MADGDIQQALHVSHSIRVGVVSGEKRRWGERGREWSPTHCTVSAQSSFWGTPVLGPEQRKINEIYSKTYQIPKLTVQTLRKVWTRGNCSDAQLKVPFTAYMGRFFDFLERRGGGGLKGICFICRILFATVLRI